MAHWVLEWTALLVPTAPGLWWRALEPGAE
jgi:hypothetical protein